MKPLGTGLSVQTRCQAIAFSPFFISAAKSCLWRFLSNIRALMLLCLLFIAWIASHVSDMMTRDDQQSKSCPKTNKEYFETVTQMLTHAPANGSCHLGRREQSLWHLTTLLFPFGQHVESQLRHFHFRECLILVVLTRVLTTDYAFNYTRI